MRLLLVEDNVALADSLLAVLKRAGYAVDWRADGRDALLLGEQEPYDLAILDLGLPGMDGLEILRSWRAGGSSECQCARPESGRSAGTDRAGAHCAPAGACG